MQAALQADQFGAKPSALERIKRQSQPLQEGATTIAHQLNYQARGALRLDKNDNEKSDKFLKNFGDFKSS